MAAAHSRTHARTHSVLAPIHPLKRMKMKEETLKEEVKNRANNTTTRHDVVIIIQFAMPALRTQF